MNTNVVIQEKIIQDDNETPECFELKTNYNLWLLQDCLSCGHFMCRDCVSFDKEEFFKFTGRSL